MIKNVSFCIVLMASFLSFSQEKDYHIIKLMPLEDDAIEHVNFYVSKIIDNRIYKNNLGIAQKGVFNKKVLSKFDKPFEDELLSYLNAVFPVDSAKQAITLRINQLLISENTRAFKETGKAIVNLDVLICDGEVSYFMGSFSASEEKNSMDVTGKHDDRIREILKNCLMQFNALDYKSIEKRPISTKKESITPIILKEPLNKGFFPSFLELYANKPFQDSLIKFKDNKNNPNKLFLEEREYKRALYYAYSDGENVYLNAANYSGEKYFVKTELIDKYLLFNDTFVNQNAVVGMSLAFGVLGVLASNTQSNVLLDMDTGQYHIIDDNKIRLLLNKDYPDLYDKMKKYPNNTMLLKSILLGLLNGHGSSKVKEILEAI